MGFSQNQLTHLEWAYAQSTRMITIKRRSGFGLNQVAMHFLHMSRQRVAATEAFELPFTSNDSAVEDRCINSVLRGLVPAEVFLFGESCEAIYHGTVMSLKVGFLMATSASF